MVLEEHPLNSYYSLFFMPSTIKKCDSEFVLSAHGSCSLQHIWRDVLYCTIFENMGNNRNTILHNNVNFKYTY